MAKVTLDRLDQKLDHLLERLQDHSHKLESHIHEDHKLFEDIRESLDGCDEYPGVRGRLDRLEQDSKRRGNQVTALWAALCSAAVAYGFTYLPK